MTPVMLWVRNPTLRRFAPLATVVHSSETSGTVATANVAVNRTRMIWSLRARALAVERDVLNASMSMSGIMCCVSSSAP